MQYRPVEITIISAKGLKRVKHLSKMDVYVVVSLSGGPEMEQKTPVDKESGPNPNWNFPMNFNIDEEEAQKGRLGLNFKVICHRRLHSDKEIGQVNVPVKELLDNGGDGKFLKYVTFQVRKPNGKHRGELNLSYKFAHQVLETTSSVKLNNNNNNEFLVPPVVTAYPVNYAVGTSSTNNYQGYSGNYCQTEPPLGYPIPIQGGNRPGSGLGYPDQHNPVFGYGYSQWVKPQNPAGNGEVDAAFLSGLLGGLLIGDILTANNNPSDGGYDFVGGRDAGSYKAASGNEVGRGY